MFTRLTPATPARSGSVTLLACALLLAAALPATAANITWSNSSGGSWSNPANWSGGQVPGLADHAILPSLGGPYTVAFDVTPGSGIEIQATDATLDVNGFSLPAAVVSNAGRILGLRGAVGDSALFNLATGVIELAPGDSIEAAGAFPNDGIIFAPTGSRIHLTRRVRFFGSGSLVLWGTSVLTGAEPPQRTVTLSNFAGHTIRGTGIIRLPVHNLGLLEVDGGFLDVQSLYYNNGGTTRVRGGGHMNVNAPGVKNIGGRIIGSNGRFTVMCGSPLEATAGHFPQGVGGAIDGSGGGQFVAEDGNLFLSAGLLLNGSIERTGSSELASVRIGIATPQNVVVSSGAAMTIDGQLDVTVDGSSLTNDGEVRVPGKLRILGFDGNSISLLGAGEVVLEGGLIETPAGATLVNGASHTITGCGTIDANLTNNGTVNLECERRIGTLGNRTIANRKSFTLRSGYVYMLGAKARFINYSGARFSVAGRLMAGQGMTIQNLGVMTADGGVVTFGHKGTSTVIGGTLAGSGTGRYRNVGATTLQNVTLAASADFSTESRGTTRATGTRLVNHGTHRIAARSTFIADPATDYVQSLEGVTLLAGGTLAAPRGVHLSGSLRGFGTVIGDVTNEGDVTADAVAAGITIQGNYRQATGSLTVRGEGSQFGRLDVAGTATLGGSLRVLNPNGDDSGQLVEVMTFGVRSGEFSNVAVGRTSPEFEAIERYGRNNLSVQIDAGVVSVGENPRALRFFTRGATFALELPKSADVSLAVYDIAGREVASLDGGRREAGMHEFALHGRDLSSGVYFGRVQLRTDGGTESRTARMVFVK